MVGFAGHHRGRVADGQPDDALLELGGAIDDDGGGGLPRGGAIAAVATVVVVLAVPPVCVELDVLDGGVVEGLQEDGLVDPAGGEAGRDVPTERALRLPEKILHYSIPI